MNFCCALFSKGAGWNIILEEIIEQTDRNSLYIWIMLTALMSQLTNEIISGRDREHVKRLVAVIRAKRTFRTQMPKTKEIDGMLKHLNKTDFKVPPTA